jgi:hypothetical protein
MIYSSQVGGQMLSINSNIKIVGRLVLTEIEDEAILLNIDQNKYYGLDELGLQIWKWVEDGNGYDELKQLIINHYDVDESIAEVDLKDFLEQLKEKGLITW